MAWCKHKKQRLNPVKATDKQSERTSNIGADADLKVFGKGIEGKIDLPIDI